jgi:hypothetical protein
MTENFERENVPRKRKKKSEDIESHGYREFEKHFLSIFQMEVMKIRLL